jgi:hypothetical protein
LVIGWARGLGIGWFVGGALGGSEARKYWLDKLVMVRKMVVIQVPSPASPLQINVCLRFVDDLRSRITHHIRIALALPEVNLCFYLF